MKTGFVSFLFAFALCALYPVAATAAEAKETTLTGEIACGKCAFNQEKECHTAIRVKEAGKDVVYLFEGDADKKHHAEICKTTKQGTVTGAVSEKDGKKWIKPSKVEYAK